MTDAWRSIDVQRVSDGRRSTIEDRAAAESPLEIRLNGQAFAMTMRTPGADRDLVAGFLLSEQVITSAADITTISHAGDESAIDVTLGDRVSDTLARRLAERRQVTTTSACGICGRQSADAVKTDAPPITASWGVSAGVVSRLPDLLRDRQAVFDHTGGLHAAGIFTTDGTLVEIAEDVGRHNAVDKVIGRLLLRGALPLSAHILCVSGRASFELVQKAVLGGIPMLVAVSAPSTMAIDIAREYGLTLAGFVRGPSFNLYAHAHRVV
ncbi:MAG: formate dehydrogenase accessory sulfurtransferase FdhD [Acidobacteria bacterium]|nr:formate dehydrogenase accessory sulfurtransferase FdhD [Acidobacteriota bacterium]